MEKDEDDSAEQPDGENKNAPEESTEEVTEEDSSEEKIVENSEKTDQPKDEENEEKKKNTDELRKVIKVGDSEQSNKNEEKPGDVDLESGSRENLEQKRAILQSIKDFDFQIKKNQEEITMVNKKLESVSKDLDDLVSLYEIVSEQMNPFVGLSKVTKKRIDALENFTKEIEDLKNRMGDIESFTERAGADLKTIREAKPERKSTPQSPVDIEKTKDVDKPINIENNKIEHESNYNLSSVALDNIIEKSLNSLSLDEKIDLTIDEFLDRLLDKNIS